MPVGAVPYTERISRQGQVLAAFEYFGGVTELLVPDQTKTAVSRPCLYDPELNPTFNEMAVHYDTAVVFDGDGGTNTAIFNGTDADETLTVRPHSAPDTTAS